MISVWDSYLPFEDTSRKPLISDWSDVTFIEWDTLRSLQDREGEPLQFFAITGIRLPQRESHKGGKDIVENVFRISRKRDLPQVPAWTFKVTLELDNEDDAEDFHTLLGTTPGNMITKLLSEHHKARGHREVKSITFYANNERARDRGDPEAASICMVFEIQGTRGEWEPKQLPGSPASLSVPDNSDDSAWVSRGGSPEPE